jgi:site-specific DNA recombinase
MLEQNWRHLRNMKNKTNSAKKQILAAIYARTSSPNQKFNYSIKEQVSSCWKYCEERGWTVKYVFVDEGKSGENTERPKFQFMLEKSKGRKFDAVISWKLDRLCRSLVDLVNTERTLRKLGIGLCSATEYIDTTTSVGRFNFRNLASVAELEREIIGERSKLGLYALAKEHKWPNPHPPLGYDKNDDGCLLPNPYEVNLVNKILRLYVKSKSFPHTAFLLNKQGIKTKKLKEWNARAVRDIVTNELYIGRFNVAGFQDYVREYKIVDRKLFKRANEIRTRYVKGNAKRPPMPKDRKTLKIEKMFNRYSEFLEKSGQPKAPIIVNFGG